MRIRSFFMLLVCAALLTSCSEDSPTDPTNTDDDGGNEVEPTPIDVVFTYVKATEHGNWDTVGTSGDIRGQLRLQPTNKPLIIAYTFDGSMEGSRTINRSHTVSLQPGELLRAYSLGLEEYDTIGSNDDIHEFSRRWTCEELVFKLAEPGAEIRRVFSCKGDGNARLEVECRISRAEEVAEE